MRDISAGRDIVDCNITEIVGSRPSNEILQQSAEELAEAEHNSRRIVSHLRKSRSLRATIFMLVALAAFGVTGVLGYYWLFQQGELELSDMIQDGSNIAVGALVSSIVALLLGVAMSGLAYGQRIPSEAENLNKSRLRTIGMRWEELKGLGLPKKEMKELRRRK